MTDPEKTPTDEQRSDDAARATAVREALAAEPIAEADEDLLAADVVTDVDVHGGDVTVVVDPDAAPGAESEDLLARVMERVDGVSTADSVDVERARPDPDVGGHVGDFDRVIAVASAKGGVGKSTVATNLAAALAGDGSHVALFDADVHGPNVPRLLDLAGPVYSTNDGDPVPIEHPDLGVEVMSVGLLESDVPLAWRGAMANSAVSDLFADTAWRHTDTMIVDLPPGTGDVVLTTLEEVPVDGIVVVTQPFHTGVADTNRTVDLFRDEGVPILGAVVNMASVACEHCGEHTPLFGGDAGDLATEVLAELPFDRAFQDRPTPGAMPDPFAELATAVADELDAIGSYDPPEDVVDLRGLPAKFRRDAVREAVATRESGESLTVASDRDPTPIREFLAAVSGAEPDAVAPFEVERAAPDAWVARTEVP